LRSSFFAIAARLGAVCCGTDSVACSEKPAVANAAVVCSTVGKV